MCTPAGATRVKPANAKFITQNPFRLSFSSLEQVSSAACHPRYRRQDDAYLAMRLGRPRGRGRGRGPAQQQASAQQASELLRVTVHLDAEKRGLVIGAQGVTVKATQAATGARITLPRRGVDGPTSVAGPTPLSVLRACALIACQASADCQCTCSLASSTELSATLHPTSADAHLLFELAADSAVAFVAYVLRVPSPVAHQAAGRAAELQAELQP